MTSFAHKNKKLGTYIAAFVHTPVPRIARILVPEKNHVTQKLRNSGTVSRDLILRELITRTCTAIQYRASTGPEQSFPCVVFPHREKPFFISWYPCNENRDGFAVYL